MEQLIIQIITYISITMVELRYIHFATYALVFTLYGCVVTAVGPIILYYSEATGEDETYFSFIFFARAIGYLVGGSLIKVLTHYMSYHRLYAFLIIICGTCLIVSSLNFGFLNLAITMLLAGSCCCMMNVISNLCIFKLFTGDNQDYWIQLLNLFFGVGGLIGPAFVIYYKELAMRAIGIVIFVCLIPLAFLHSPEAKQVQNTQVKTKKLELPRVAEFCLCFMLFLYIAEEVGYAGWIPTYAFKAHVADQKGSSALASIFWIVNTIARLILLYLKGTVADRLSVLLKLLVISTFTVLVIQWFGYLSVVAYAGVISSGFFLSAMYALFFSIAQEYGYELSTSNTANFAMSASLGEGFLVMPIGYVMGLLGYKALIYIIFIFSAVMLVTFNYVNEFMKKDSKEKKEGLMTPLKQLEKY